VKPFIDALQQNLEYVVTVLNILSVVILFPFLRNLTSAGDLAITIVFVILQVLGKIRENFLFLTT
jgi:hypothetical protein